MCSRPGRPPARRTEGVSERNCNASISLGQFSGRTPVLVDFGGVIQTGSRFLSIDSIPKLVPQAKNTIVKLLVAPLYWICFQEWLAGRTFCSRYLRLIPARVLLFQLSRAI